MPDAWDSGLRVKIENTVDLKQIQKFMDEANVEILVGFPSGMEHVQTMHKDDYEHKNERRRGQYVGIHGGDPHENPIETAELAKMLSYGTSTIPARPFLEEGIMQNAEQLKKALEEEVIKLQETGKANWNKVGSMAKGAVEEFVRGDYYKNNVPNSKNTIQWKGSDTPLIDGGNLIQSLHYVVNGVVKK